MRTCVFTMWHNCTHHVPGAKAKVLLRTGSVSFRESVFISLAHLAIPMPYCLNEQWSNLVHFQKGGSASTYACSIDPVGLGQTPRGAIELGTPSTPRLH